MSETCPDDCHCRRSPALTRDEAARRLTPEQVELFFDYVVDNGADHDDDCPEDDTCTCSYKARNDAVNAVCDAVEALYGLPVETPTKGDETP